MIKKEIIMIPVVEDNTDKIIVVVKIRWYNRKVERRTFPRKIRRKNCKNMNAI